MESLTKLRGQPAVFLQFLAVFRKLLGFDSPASLEKPDYVSASNLGNVPYAPTTNVCVCVFYMYTMCVIVNIYRDLLCM